MTSIGHGHLRMSTGQRSFAFHRTRQFGTVCHQLCETAVCLWERSKGA